MSDGFALRACSTAQRRSALLALVWCFALLLAACGADGGGQTGDDPSQEQGAQGPLGLVDLDLEFDGEELDEDDQVPWPGSFDPDTEKVQQVRCPDAVPHDEGILCAFVIVPADHAAPERAQMALSVAVLPALGGGAERNGEDGSRPAIYLEGGPGFGAVPEAEGWTFPPLSELRHGRPLVLVDQRGTGYSRPALDCEELDGEGVDDPEAVGACAARLRSGGIDPGWYHSAASAADVALLRRLLGVDSWDLIGSSYGSRLALTVLRDDPEGVAAVAIDGIYPPDADGAGVRGVRQSALFAMDRFVAICSADPDCEDLLGDPEAVLVDAVSELDAIADADESSPLNGADLVYFLPNLVVAPELAWILLEVAEGDRDAVDELDELIEEWVGGFARAVSDEDAASESAAMRLSLDCAEEVPFAQGATPDVSIDRWPAWLLEIVDSAALDPLCDLWGVPAQGPIEAEPVVSDVPVLLVSGQLDAVTPPVWADQAASALTAAQLVSVPHLGHDALLDECVVSIVVAFLDDPEVPVERGCLAGIEPFRYDT